MVSLWSAILEAQHVPCRRPPLLPYRPSLMATASRGASLSGATRRCRTLPIYENVRTSFPATAGTRVQPREEDGLHELARRSVRRPSSSKAPSTGPPPFTRRPTANLTLRLPPGWASMPPRPELRSPTTPRCGSTWTTNRSPTPCCASMRRTGGSRPSVRTTTSRARRSHRSVNEVPEDRVCQHSARSLPFLGACFDPFTRIGNRGGCPQQRWE